MSFYEFKYILFLAVICQLANSQTSEKVPSVNIPDTQYGIVVVCENQNCVPFSNPSQSYETKDLMVTFDNSFSLAPQVGIFIKDYKETIVNYPNMICQIQPSKISIKSFGFRCIKVEQEPLEKLTMTWIASVNPKIQIINNLYFYLDVGNNYSGYFEADSLKLFSMGIDGSQYTYYDLVKTYSNPAQIKYFCAFQHFNDDSSIYIMEITSSQIEFWAELDFDASITCILFEQTLSADGLYYLHFEQDSDELEESSNSIRTVAIYNQDQLNNQFYFIGVDEFWYSSSTIKVQLELEDSGVWNIGSERVIQVNLFSTSLAVSYLSVNMGIITKYTCQDGYYMVLESSSYTCFSCNQKCQTCTINSSNCLTCAENRDINTGCQSGSQNISPEIPDTQFGIVTVCQNTNCPPLSNPSSYYQSKDITVTFDTAFSSTPQVGIFIKDYKEAVTDYPNMVCLVQPSTISTTSFGLRCVKVEQDALEKLTMTWIASTNPKILILNNLFFLHNEGENYNSYFEAGNKKLFLMGTEQGINKYYDLTNTYSDPTKLEHYCGFQHFWDEASIYITDVTTTQVEFWVDVQYDASVSCIIIDQTLSSDLSYYLFFEKDYDLLEDSADSIRTVAIYNKDHVDNQFYFMSLVEFWYTTYPMKFQLELEDTGTWQDSTDRVIQVNQFTTSNNVYWLQISMAIITKYNCQEGFYMAETGNDYPECFECHSYCATCINTSTNCLTCALNSYRDISTLCTSCIDNHYLNPNDDTCVTVCPFGFYESDTNNSCENCNIISNCDDCTSQTNCILCNTSYLVQNGSCFSSCSSNQYSDGQTCHLCNNECQTCSGPNNNQCLSCPADTLIQIDPAHNLQTMNFCVNTCLTGYYQQSSYCIKCYDNCLECINGTSCSDCDDTIYQHQNQCLQVCPDTYYGDDSTHNCEVCHARCRTCTGGDDNECTQCKAEQIRQLENQFCICQDGYYQDGVQDICQQCHPTCLTCDGGTKNDCTSCYSEQHRHLQNDGTHQLCLCDTSYLEVNEETICNKCHHSCQDCFDLTEQGCVACNIDIGREKFLDSCKCQIGLVDQYPKSVCQNSCDSGYYIYINECRPCYPLCKTCTGPLSYDCIECAQRNSFQLNLYSEKKQYNTYESIQFEGNIEAYICEQNQVQENKINGTYKFVLVEQLNENIVQEIDMQPIEIAQVSKIIEKRTLKESTNYIIELQVEQDYQISKKQFFFSTLQNEFTHFFKEGDRIQSRLSQLKLEAIIKYPAVSDDPITDLSELILEWSCLDLIKSVPCENMLNDQLKFNNSLIQTYEKKTLVPNQVLTFALKITNKTNSETKISNVQISIISDSFPFMSVQLPERFINSYINVQEDIPFEIYMNNQNQVLISVNLYYQFDSVGFFMANYEKFNTKIWNSFMDFIDNYDQLTLQVRGYDTQYYQPAIKSYKIKANIPPQNCQLRVYPDTIIELETEHFIQAYNCMDEQQSFLYQFYLYMKPEDLEEDTSLGQFYYGFHLSAFSPYGQIKTILPRFRDELTIYVSIQDNQGGIRNISQTVQVQENQNLDEQKLMDKVKNELNQNKITLIQIISLSLSNKDGYLDLKRFLYSEILQLKTEKIEDLQKKQLMIIEIQLLNQLENDPNIQLSFDNEFVIKELDLIKNSLIAVKQQDNGYLKQRLVNMNYVKIQNLQNLIASLLFSAEIKLENTQNDDQTQLIAKKQENVELLFNLSNLQLLLDFPNERINNFKFKGCQIITSFTTSQFLIEILGQNIISSRKNYYFDQEDENQDQDKDKNEIFYGLQHISLDVNPYYPNKQIINPPEYKTSILKIKNQSKEEFNLSENENIKLAKNLSQVISPIKPQQEVETSEEYDCISEINIDKWTAQECITEKRNDDFVCTCQKLTTVTVTKKIQEILEDADKKINNVNQNFSNISKFTWDKAIIFWIAIFFTAFFYFLTLWGYKKDKIDRIQIVPSQEVEMLDNKKELQEDNQISQKEQITRDSRIKFSLMLVDDKKLKLENKIPSNENEVSNENNVVSNLIIEETIHLSQKQKNEKKEKPEKDLVYQGESFHKDKNPKESGENKKDINECSIENDNQNIDLQHKNEVKTNQEISLSNKSHKSEKNKIQQKKSFLQFIKEGHPLSNIIFVYNKDMGRPLRACLYYILFLITLAITLFFGQELEIVKTILIMGIAAIVTTVALKFFQITIGSNYLILMFIGITSYFCSIIFLIYIILSSVAATKTYEQSNNMAIQYAVNLGYDNLFFQILVLLIKYKIAEYKAKKSRKE